MDAYEALHAKMKSFGIVTPIFIFILFSHCYCYFLWDDVNGILFIFKFVPFSFGILDLIFLCVGICVVWFDGFSGFSRKTNGKAKSLRIYLFLGGFSFIEKE